MHGCDGRCEQELRGCADSKHKRLLQAIVSLERSLPFVCMEPGDSPVSPMHNLTGRSDCKIFYSSPRFSKLNSFQGSR